MDGAIVERNASVSIGSIVHIQTRVPADTVVPLKHIVIGNPCKLFAPDQADAVIDALMLLNFREYVFDLRDNQILAEIYSRSLGAHFKDRTLEIVDPSLEILPEPVNITPARSTKRKK